MCIIIALCSIFTAAFNRIFSWCHHNQQIYGAYTHTIYFVTPDCDCRHCAIIKILLLVLFNVYLIIFWNKIKSSLNLAMILYVNIDLICSNAISVIQHIFNELNICSELFFGYCKKNLSTVYEILFIHMFWYNLEFRYCNLVNNESSPFAYSNCDFIWFSLEAAPSTKRTSTNI